ncbi:sulfotransferase family protein [Vulcanococcus limneticus]|uniref:sulfotransferase family protein n=1 Tax=Vulcanococcus limneticus TaxID=2170428 RepID=UPI00398C1ED0
MTDIFLLTTSAAWQKLNRLCTGASQWQETGQDNIQLHAINYISLSPYSTADANHHLAEVAKKDIISACSLSLYRASLLFAYKHIINEDLEKANNECHNAITFLRESLERLGITTKPDRYDLSARTRCFVNSLVSQAELQQARITSKIGRHFVFILGMHRSGTSALTGMLVQAGFTAPSDLMPATVANPKGYWESLGIMGINEGFLAEMESHWSSSLPLPAGWSESISARKWRTSLINLISEVIGGAQLAMIKDPRFCTLIMGLEPWFESRLINTSFIIPIRHPLEVANSLLQAQGIDLYKALRLWIKSIFMTEQATRGYRRKFINFDVLIQDPANCLEACLQLVESPPDPENKVSMADEQNVIRPKTNHQATAFIDKRLKRQHPIITEECSYKLGHSCNTRLIQLADSVFYAIISNIEDDRSLAKALDKLWPEVVHASV